MKKILFTTLLLIILTACVEFKQGLQNDLASSQKIPLPPIPTNPGMTPGEGLSVAVSVGKAVPSWASTNGQIWAAPPTGISLTNLNNNGQFDKIANNQLSVQITGYDLVWSKLYYPDNNYVLSQIVTALGIPINQITNDKLMAATNIILDPTKVWPIQADIPDQNGQVSTTGHWIQLPNQQTTLTVNIPTTNFQINPFRFNAVAIYACKKLPTTTASQTGNYFEYDCNNPEGTTPNTLKVKSDGTGLVLGSGTGAWMLKDFTITCNNQCSSNTCSNGQKTSCTGPDTNNCFSLGTTTNCPNSCNTAGTDCATKPSLITPRSYSTAITNGNNIYIIGGQDNNGNILSSIEHSTINSDGSINPFTTLTTTLNTPRSSASSVLQGNNLYVIGGATSGGSILNSIEKTVIQSDGTLSPFTTLTTTLTTRRVGHASAVSGNNIYVLGGINGASNLLNTVERTTINNDGTLTPFVATSNLNTPRFNFAALINNNNLYALFGAGPGSAPQGSIEQATINTDGTLTGFTQTLNAGTPISYYSAVINGNNMYFISGSSTTGLINNVQKASINTDGTLTALTNMATLTTPRLAHTTVLSGNNIYTIGGKDTQGNILNDVEITNIPCTTETDTQFCTRLRKTCGTITAQDNCGTSKTINCGSCTNGNYCNTGTCNTCNTLPNYCASTTCSGTTITTCTTDTTTGCQIKTTSSCPSGQTCINNACVTNQAPVTITLTNCGTAPCSSTSTVVVLVPQSLPSCTLDLGGSCSVSAGTLIAGNYYHINVISSPLITLNTIMLLDSNGNQIDPTSCYATTNCWLLTRNPLTTSGSYTLQVYQSTPPTPYAALVTTPPSYSHLNWPLMYSTMNTFGVTFKNIGTTMWTSSNIGMRLTITTVDNYGNLLNTVSTTNWAWPSGITSVPSGSSITFNQPVSRPSSSTTNQEYLFTQQLTNKGVTFGPKYTQTWFLGP